MHGRLEKRKNEASFRPIRVYDVIEEYRGGTEGNEEKMCMEGRVSHTISKDSRTEAPEKKV